MENNEYEKTILSFLQMSVVKKKIRPRSGLRKYYNYVVINKIGDMKKILIAKDTILIMQSLIVDLIVKVFGITDSKLVIKLANQHIKTILI